MLAEVVGRLLLAVAERVKASEEEAVAQRAPMEGVCAVETQEALVVQELGWLNVLDETLTLRAGKWKLKLRQGNSA